MKQKHYNRDAMSEISISSTMIEVLDFFCINYYYKYW